MTGDVIGRRALIRAAGKYLVISSSPDALPTDTVRLMGAPVVIPKDPDPTDLTQTRGQPITRSTPKVGRNEPCPCGSSRKYKKCCAP